MRDKKSQVSRKQAWLKKATNKEGQRTEIIKRLQLKSLHLQIRQTLGRQKTSVVRKIIKKKKKNLKKNLFPKRLR